MELVHKAEEFGIERVEAEKLTEGLPVIMQEREMLIAEFVEVSNLEITEDNLPLFKDLRLKIRDNRTKGIEKWHKLNKAFFLAGGRFVDAIKNKECDVNIQMEDKLMAAEKHFENLEKQRIESLRKNRAALCLQLGEVEPAGLGEMEQSTFEALLSGLKAQHDAKLKAERKAEAERKAKEIADRKERKRIKAENELLRKEAEAKQKEFEAERAKAKAEADRIEAERQAELKAEREKQAKLQAELEAKRQDELKAEKERQEAEAKAKAEADKLAKAPVKIQLNKWVNSFNIGGAPIENETSEEIQAKFTAFKKWALSQIEKI